MFAGKIIDEIMDTGGIVPVKNLKEDRWERKEKGVGVNCLTLVEQQFLLDLPCQDPTRTNESYISSIFHCTGNIVSSSFISTFFQNI